MNLVWRFLALMAVGLHGAQEPTLPAAQIPDSLQWTCQAIRSFYRQLARDTGFVELHSTPSLRFDLRYAGSQNLTGAPLYCGQQRVFLHRDAALLLRDAVVQLKRIAPKHSLVVFDATRPIWAQELLRRKVRGTPVSHYVSSPATGSLHNYGMAVDIGMADSSGQLLAMGCDYDAFVPYAGRRGEDSAFVAGVLEDHHLRNRNLLRKVMQQAGWVALPSEWWHFGAAPSAVVRAKYRRVDSLYVVKP